MQDNENEINRRETKICNKCKIPKKFSEFYINKSSCKLCRKDYNLKNKEREKEYSRNYNKRYKEKRREYDKQYHKENKEFHYENHKKWRKENKEKHQEYLKNYYKENLDKKKQYHKQYDENNKDRRRKYEYKKLRGDIQFKLRKVLRIRLHSALKNNSKYSSALLLLGCLIEEFKLYLEQQFLPEMTWLNYGKVWEIDHIKACANFDLTNFEQQKQCFHYTNMMPRFKTTEIAKSFGSNQMGNRNKNKY